MSGIKSPESYSKLWLIPSLSVLIATLFQELFSLIDDSVFVSLGLIFGYKGLLLTCLFLISILSSLWIRYASQQKLFSVPTSNKQSEKEVRAKREHILGLLSLDEKSFLAMYIKQQTKVLRLHMGHPIANGLMSQGILYTTGTSDISLNLDYHIQPWVWEILNNNQKLLS